MIGGKALGAPFGTYWDIGALGSFQRFPFVPFFKPVPRSSKQVSVSARAWNSDFPTLKIVLFGNLNIRTVKPRF